MRYKRRWITELLQEVCADHPIVVLTGARQVGKSTLLLNAEPTGSWRYLSLDDYDVLEQVRSDPLDLLSVDTPTVIDEAQRAPELLMTIKRLVDENRLNRRFVLSGSANLLLMSRVSETLAGRAVFLRLNPMTWGEFQEFPSPTVLEDLLSGRFPEEREIEGELDLTELVWRGGMPPVLGMRTHRAILQWWEGYVTTYLERDLRDLAQINSLSDFRRVMIALALRTGQVLNQSEIARDVAVPQPTVHRYLNLLEASMLFERLPSFARSRTKRLIKSPKAYLVDSGLAAFLQGIYSPGDLRSAREWGGLLESFVLHHLRSWAELQVPPVRIYFWRTTSGLEVDFVLERGRDLLAIEVKSSGELRLPEIKGLKAFLNENPQARCGVLAYTGKRVVRLTGKVIALPIRMFLGDIPN